MTPEQRQELIRLLEQNEEISPEWARVLFPPEKREYELVYHGKDREEDIIADTLAVPLQPVRTFGKNGVDWHNMLIFGDNLQAMKTLLEMKKEGKLVNADGAPGVSLIYIDPPFATKREFSGSKDQKAYQDKISGSEFLEFLRRRLVLLRELLSDDGLIYIHLDQKKSHAIKLLMDEIFGESNFLNEIIWKYTKFQMRDMTKFAKNTDRLLLYAKSSSYKFYPITYKLDEPKKLLMKGWDRDLGRIVNIKDNKGKTQKITIYDEKVDDLWEVPYIGATAHERLDYPTQKPEKILDWVIKSATKEGDVVLDAFAGSGTTLAVAEKFGRRWIGIDCGKLAIYTIQKRLLNLKCEIGNNGLKLETKPFALYNAGLYDFSKLKELSWQDWRFFALQLFQCRDEPHKIGGIEFDGYRQGASVMIFNHMEAKHKDARITEETIQEIHEAVGTRGGNKVFIIAPALTFDFQQDYIDVDKVRYYALRIPYSIIHELHRREFTALKQPADEMAVNDTVEAVGFDFIRTPELKYKTGTEKSKGDLAEVGFIKIETFKSDAVIREPFKKKGNLETLSMVLLDFNYDDESNVFDLDEVHYAEAIEKAGWKVRFGTAHLGEKIMAVFLDIYGNEARVLIDEAEFGKTKSKATLKKKSAKKK
jgi:site-specific DNA-methyltransferase (adenine-specific)/adenine-specific DNA-methyltransferase